MSNPLVDEDYAKLRASQIDDEVTALEARITELKAKRKHYVPDAAAKAGTRAAAKKA